MEKKHLKVKIEDLKDFPHNPKKHDVNLIEKSIKEFGFVDDVVIDETNTILSGHGRVKALKKLGEKEVDAIQISGWTDEQKRKYLLTANQSVILGGFENDELKLFDKEELEFAGFDMDMFITPDEKDDQVPEVPKVANSKLGDLYWLGGHRVLCGDSTKKEDVDRLMGGKKADMVFTDPPYGMNLDADFSSMEGIGKGKKYNNVIGDDIDYNPEHIFRDLGYCKEIFLWGADYYANLIPNRNVGSWIVWDKTEGGISPNSAYDKMYGSNFELCWSKFRHKRALARVLWKGIFGLAKEDTKKRLHPTQKPVELCNWFITKWSEQNDLIVDLFLGVGSTLIACEKTNRVCYGMEIDPIYIDVIVQRYVDYTGNNKIKLNGQEIEWENS